LEISAYYTANYSLSLLLVGSPGANPIIITLEQAIPFSFFQVEFLQSEIRPTTNASSDPSPTENLTEASKTIAIEWPPPPEELVQNIPPRCSDLPQ
ncbi:hypothetical protein OESDEN_24222, partial [Oesophagostomum dentatum]